MSENVADYLLERLRDWGVDTVFAYPGDGINGILAACGRADDDPHFVQSRHEEMSAFEAVGYAKFTGTVGVCMATSGPGAIHLLNGLYDAKLDHVPVVAIVGQTNRTAMGGSYQQEVDLLSLYKDVASDYVQMVTVPEQLPNVLDRAIRTAHARRAPTALIIPADVQELDYSAAGARVQDGAVQPRHVRRRRCARDERPVRRAAEVLNAGSKVAILVGQGARGARAETRAGRRPARRRRRQGAARQGRPADELPYVTGSIGLLGTRPSYEMMMDCDTLLTVGSSFPYTQFLPEFGQARGVQIDIDPTLIGMRYPYEVNLVGDAATTLRALLAAAGAQAGTERGARQIENNVARWWETMEAEADGRRRPGQPDAARSASSTPGCPTTRSSPPTPGRPPTGTPASCSSAATCAARCPARSPPWAPACRTRSAPSSPPATGRSIALRGDGAMQMNGMAELITVTKYWQRVGRPAADRRRPAQQRPQPGHLGDARDAGRAEVRRVPVAARRAYAGFAASIGLAARYRGRPGPARTSVGRGAVRRPADGPGRALRPGRAADPAARDVRADRRTRRALLSGDEDRWGVIKEGHQDEGAGAAAGSRSD